MEVVIEHLGAVQFEIKARTHSIVSDQPKENGGFDEGMTPPELLLASLGSCAAFYAAQYLRKHKLAKEGTRVRVTAVKEKNPARIDHFQIQVDVPAMLDEQHRAGVEDAVHHCLIHNTLLHPPEVRFEFKTRPCCTNSPGCPWGFPQLSPPASFLQPDMSPGYLAVALPDAYTGALPSGKFRSP